MRIGTRLLLLLLVGALALPVFAQRPGGRPGGPPGQMRGGAITGTVIDADTGQPVELATATVWSARDSSLVTGALTDAEGGFDIRPLRPGRYYLTLTYVGYVNQRIDDLALRPGSLVADLGTLELVPDAALLEGVQVEGIRDDIEVQVDRTVFNTADQIAADVGSVTDLLRNVPAIEVDIDGNISLRGNQNVAVQINGRPVPITGAFLASYLQQLPASSVERVEVIPNPSAKYEPEGLGGIINIILKENTDLGLSGGLTAAAETIGGYNVSGNVGYQRGPWTTFVTYGLRRNVRESGGINDADFTLPLAEDGTPRLDTRFTDDDGESQSLGHLLSASADYKLSPKMTLSASGRLSLGFGSDEEVNFRNELFDDGNRLQSFRLSDEDEDDLNGDLALTFSRVQARSTDELTVEARYTADARDDFSVFTEGSALVDGAVASPTVTERNTTDRFKQEGSLQLDWVKPLGDLSLETGFRSEFTRTDDDFVVDTLALDAFQSVGELSNSFVFDEQVHAVYGLLSRSFGPLSLKAGARLEQAFTTFDLAQPAPGQDDSGAFDNDYFSVFPSAFATYQFTDGVSAQASYSRRINRPSTRALNPFENREDPLNVRVGNPGLQPEYTDSYEVGLTWFTPKTTLTVTPFYRRTTDAITRFSTPPDDNGRTVRTFVNFDTEENYGVETVGSLRFGQRFSSFVTLSAYQFQTDGQNADTDLAANGFQWSLRGNLSYNFPTGTAVQFFGFYRAPRDIPNGLIEAFSFTNLSVRQKLLDDRASLAVTMGDVFDTAGFEFAIRDRFSDRVGERRWQARFLTFTFNYTFGQQPQRRPDRQRGGRGQGGGDESTDF
ncbi:MAG: outer membrane beta-barrel family protein [Bacteroidota bacterium]